MNPKHCRSLAVAALALLAPACIDEQTPPSYGQVFIGDYYPDAIFQPFEGADPTAVARDPNTFFQGSASLAVTVPSGGDPAGTYAGGAITGIDGGRDLTGFNALTFWAKASVAATLAVAGIGNDDTGKSLHMANLDGLPLTTNWQQYIVPLPDPSVLTNEGGYFFFSAAPQGQPLTGYTVWFNTIQFEKLNSETLGAPQPSIQSQTLTLETGDPITIANTAATFALDGGGPQGSELNESLEVNYFTFDSSNTAVAAFEGQASTLARGAGTATVTGFLDNTPATGTVTLEVAAVDTPTLPPPEPTLSPNDVISLLSSVYTPVPVDTFLASYSDCDQEFDLQLGADDVKKYEGLNYAAIAFTSTPIDASAMTTLHVALWTPDSTSLQVKLVNFGSNGAFDYQGDLTYDQTSSPALVQDAWMNLEIPLSAFVDAGLTADNNLEQLYLSGTNSTLYVDDIYFHD